MRFDDVNNKWMVARQQVHPTIFWDTVSVSKDIAIKRAIKRTGKNWPDLQKQGYQCININLEVTDRKLAASADIEKRTKALDPDFGKPFAPKIKTAIYKGVKQEILANTPKWQLDLIEKNKNRIVSEGEMAVAKFLSLNNISFIQEYIVQHSFGPHNKIYFFDFYIPKYDAFIEFDGIYHFKQTAGSDLDKQKTQDLLKNKWCNDNGKPLLRINCFDSDKLEEMICTFFDRLSPISKAS